jgi:signal peptidase complex subunit 3
MYSISKRVSTLLSYTFTFTVTLLVSIFIMSYTSSQETPECHLAVSSYSLTGDHSRYISFSPSIDLTSQFHLNVKQIFLYLRITYGENSDMAWSTIVKRHGNKVLSGNYFNNYRIPPLNAKRALLELRGCIFPYIGQTRDILYAKKELDVK